jgi:hypothetical protein
MNADEPIEDVGRRCQLRIIQDANGHFYVERDGIQTEEAFHRGNHSDASMRADGYRPVAEVYPEVTEHPLIPGGANLDDLYVPARRITDDPSGVDGWRRRRGRSGPK